MTPLALRRYHVSDAWTLLANDALHFFDPLRQAVAIAPENGRKYATKSLDEKGCVDQLAPFRAIMEDWPTVFRLPLRTRGSQFGLPISVAEAEELLRGFVVCAEESLVLSKHVRSVELATSETMLATCAVGGETTDVHQLLQSLPTTLAEVQALENTPRRVAAELTISKTVSDQSGSQTTETTWLVAHALECDAAASELLLQEFERGNALLPHGAAALRLGAPHDYAGHFCCTFPLASLACGPPLLLHGHFGLPSSRKSLPLALNVADGRWNAALLQGALASALGLVVERCRDLVLGRKLSLSAYFELIELPDNDTNRASAEPRSEAREGFEPGIDRDAAWRDPQSPVFESRLDSCALHCCSACSVAHLSTPSRWQHSARMTQNP